MTKKLMQKGILGRRTRLIKDPLRRPRCLRWEDRVKKKDVSTMEPNGQME